MIQRKKKKQYFIFKLLFIPKLNSSHKKNIYYIVAGHSYVM